MLFWNATIPFWKSADLNMQVQTIEKYLASEFEFGYFTSANQLKAVFG